MGPELSWVEGSWPGKLAVTPRPRGGDWLQDEVSSWKRAGVSVVLSLLTPQEELEFDLGDEAAEVRNLGLKFLSLPIPDRHVPSSETKFAEVLEQTNSALSKGKNVLVHCRQGVGRSGLVAACLLIKNGMSSSAAIDAVSAARGVAVPETREQRDWIEHYSPALTK